MKGNRLFFCLLALCAAGCAGGPEAIDVAKFRPASPIRAKAAFVLESSVPRQYDRAAASCSLPVDAETAKAVLVDPVLSLNAFHSQEVAAASGSLGADFEVALRITNHRVRFHGKNRWWIPSMVVWFLVLAPSWWIPDETFTADLAVEVAVSESRSGNVLYRKEITASAVQNLNDLDRGWTLLAIVDDSLEEENYRKAARHLDRTMWNDVVPKVLEAVGVEFPAELAKTKWAPEGTARALVVGVGEEGCQTDAERVAAYLRGPAGIPRENIVLVKAGWEEILLALARNPESRPFERIRRTLDEWKALPFPERDQVFFYFSGQGALMPDGAPAIVTENGGEGRVRLTRVLDALARFKDSTVVVDAGFRPQGGARSLPGPEKPDADAFERKIARSASSILLAAPLGAEGLESPKTGTGVFTDYVLKAAAGRANRDGDKTTSPRELSEYLRSQVKGFALILGREAEPFLQLPDSVWLPSGEK
ncbi:MAG: hypothetical protein MUC63_05730 [Planctomycetes bacterium]|nr:hypothetical protein [Planctomycetota bacterium]